MLQGVFPLCPGTNAVDLAAMWNFRGFPSTKMNSAFLGRKRGMSGIFLNFTLIYLVLFIRRSKRKTEVLQKLLLAII